MDSASPCTHWTMPCCSCHTSRECSMFLSLASPCCLVSLGQIVLEGVDTSHASCWVYLLRLIIYCVIYLLKLVVCSLISRTVRMRYFLLFIIAVVCYLVIQNCYNNACYFNDDLWPWRFFGGVSSRIFLSKKKSSAGSKNRERTFTKRKIQIEKKVMRRLDYSPSIDELVEDHFRSQVSQVLYLLFFQ